MIIRTQCKKYGESSMTTLAFDGRYAAADGRATCGNTITGRQAKKLFLIEGKLGGEDAQFLYMGAGSWSMVQLVKKWLSEGGDILSSDPEQAFPQVEDFEGMVITRDGEVFELEATMVALPSEVPVAGGSGFPFAITAMNLGQNAVQAVYTAMEMDIGSGGKVTAFDIETWQFIEPGDVR